MTRPFVVVLLVAALGAALPVAAAPPPPTDTARLDALLALAREQLDVEGEDAVLLSERRREEWTADGRRSTTVHRLLYVRTDHGVKQHADLRLPHDGDRERLEVHLLRTFRLSDRRWVESGPTARVETLPFAAATAADYAHRRETMLLHDGVEVPCVLETAYTVADVEPHRPGSDGVWTLSRSEPAVRAELVLAFPPGALSRFTGPVAPQRSVEAETGLEILTFVAGPVAALPRPRTADTAVGVPHVAWSTWPDWAALGRDLEQTFTAALVVDDALRAAAAGALRDARTPAETVRRVTTFVADSTRTVGEVDRGWWAPRPAWRTWATAHGDRLDRTVLAAALLREAGLEAHLALRSRAPGTVDQGAATTQLLDGPALWVRGRGVEGFLDLADDRAVVSSAAVFGRALWRPGRDPQPVFTPVRESRLTVRLDLAWDDDGARWTGHGLLEANGALCPFERMAGLATETLDEVRAVAGKVLPGATVSSANAEGLGPGAVTVGFALEAPAPTRDPRDRLRLVLGDPPGVAAILDRWRVRASQVERTAPVLLPGALELRLELHLELGALEPALVPEERSLVNRAGQVWTTVEREGARLAVTRVLRLEGSVADPARWPDLRELLLAHDHERGRTVLLR